MINSKKLLSSEDLNKSRKILFNLLKKLYKVSEFKVLFLRQHNLKRNKVCRVSLMKNKIVAYVKEKEYIEDKEKTIECIIKQLIMNEFSINKYFKLIYTVLFSVLLGSIPFSLNTQGYELASGIALLYFFIIVFVERKLEKLAERRLSNLNIYIKIDNLSRELFQSIKDYIKCLVDNFGDVICETKVSTYEKKPAIQINKSVNRERDLTSCRFRLRNILETYRKILDT